MVRRALEKFMGMKRNEKRKRLFGILASVVGTVAVLWFGYWYFVGSHYISTDNAYVGAEIAQVTPAIDGTIKEVNVIDTQKVKAGDVLVVIDDIDAKLALARAKGAFDKAKTDLDRAGIDLTRRKALAASGSVSGEELTTAENAFRASKAVFDAAQAALDQTAVDLDRTVIKAPVDGVIAKREVQLGQKVRAGTQLMAVVPLGNVHVNANFKEVQLRKVKEGQPVKLWSDLYGSDIVYQGKVVGLSGGTGAVFSLIPAQNATGNWIKVVQRLPVRIELDLAELASHPLQVGLSMNVEIDTSKNGNE
ncbi:MAG: efflux RND transporter periplasmic adaptor subunit [Alphaproteobacteria bacterium]|nr:efflux RND transporter periplasmic adaptor subunit [Alphaproteobacteria bacterium]